MRHIGFIVEDGFQVMGLAAVSAFEFANAVLEQPGYSLTLMSQTGACVSSSLGVSVTETKKWSNSGSSHSPSWVIQGSSGGSGGTGPRANAELYNMPTSQK